MALIKNWLRKDLQLLETLTDAEQEKCEASEGLFQTLSNKFQPRYNETIKSLQFHKLVRKPDENAKEWMSRLRTAAKECIYKEIDRQLKEHFIHCLYNSNMSIEIIRELTKVEDNENTTLEQVLMWERRVVA